MPFCPECGADVRPTDAFCEACGESLIRGGREPLRTQRPPAQQPAEADDVAAGRVQDAYPALRMGRLRRLSQRNRRPGGSSPARSSAPPAQPEAPEEDMEPATLLARPQFDDIEDTPAPGKPAASSAAQYVADELKREPAPEAAAPPKRKPEPPPPFSDEHEPDDGPREPRPERPLAKVYGALVDPATNPPERRSVRLGERQGVSSKGAQPAGKADWDKDAAPTDLAEPRGRLRERFAGPDLDVEDGAAEPTTGQRRMDRARLTSPKRSDIRTKRLTTDYEDDAVLSELAKQYSREYTGRDGWSFGAIVDSLAYLFRGLGRAAGRTMAVRRLRKERESRERVRGDQLSELGEVALSLRDLDNALLDDYRNRLLELHHDQEMREDEVDSLTQQIEESRRNAAHQERERHSRAEELSGQTQQAEDALRPVENGYRSAIKAARSAEEDARALGRQIDHARGELNRLSGQEGAADDAARLKAKIERWTSERDGLLHEVPRLEEKAAALEPEIETLRKNVERSKLAQREHREESATQEAELKRALQRLEGEIERIRVAIEKLSGQRRTLFGECGRQIDIDRPDHDHLEEIYGELDASAGDIRRIDHEIEIAQSKPEPWDYGALTRAFTAIGGCFAILILLIVLLR